MKTGMVWFDNDPKAEMKTKLDRAAAYYAKKYGQIPNLCFVHPTMNPPEKIGGIEMRTNRSILPNHFWIGVAEGVKAR